MSNKAENIREIFESSDFLNLISGIIKPDQKDLLDKIGRSLNEYRREVLQHFEYTSYPHSPTVTLALIDNREIIRFRLIHKYSEITIKEIFQPINQKLGDEILAMTPISPKNIKIEWGRTYFDDGVNAFELLIWTVIAEKKVKRDDQYYAYADNNYKYYSYNQFDECYISDKKGSDSIRDLWRFYDYYSSEQGEKLSIQGKASCNHYRQRDYEVDYAGTFDLSTGEIVLEKYYFGDHDYK